MIDIKGISRGSRRLLIGTALIVAAVSASAFFGVPSAAQGEDLTSSALPKGGSRQPVAQAAVTPTAKAALNALRTSAGETISSSVSRQTGVYDFVRATDGAILHADKGSGSPEKRALAFLAEHGAVFGLTSAERSTALTGKGSDGSNFSLRNIDTDEAGLTHVKFDQQYKGLRVFGAQLVVHMNDGGITAANGNFVPAISLNIIPKIDENRAAEIATATGAKVGAGSPVIEKTELAIYRRGLLEGYEGRSVLAYSVEIKGEDVYEQVWIDATTGEVLNRVPLQHSVLNRIVYSPTFDPANPNNNIVVRESDPVIPPAPASPAHNLFHYAGQTFNLYKSAFGRDSYDGIGALPQRSVLLANDKCPNAYWDGVAASYCPDFDKDDIVSHEWSHGYTQFTHNLIYSYQSGALNESYSDFFGEAVDLHNGVDGAGGSNNATPTTYSIQNGQYVPSGGGQRWRIGEDLTGISQPAALGISRDMWTPEAFQDPSTVTSDEYHCVAGDAGGVHTNSGVPNLAYAMLVDGRTYNGQTITGIGFTRAMHIYYRAMTTYQIESTNFAQHEQALRASCDDLIGQPLKMFSTTSATTAVSPDTIQPTHCQQLVNAMAAVEMSAPPEQCNFQLLLDPLLPADCAGSTDLYSEDWETGMDGWTTATTGVTADWPNTNFAVRDNLPPNPDSLAHEGKAAFAINPQIGEPNGGTCQPGGDVSGKFSITSPAITIPAEAEAPRVSFEHFVQTEGGFDGGNVKISVNGGAFVVVPQDQFTFNAPRAVLSSTADGNTNPMAGEFAWHGANEGELSGSWGTTIINLANLTNPGDNVKVRFEFGQDGCNGNLGWFVDKVRVYHCPVLQAPVLTTGADYTNPDPNGSYTLNWTRPNGATGPDEVEESTSCGAIFTDDAAQTLVAGANSKWTGSPQWTSAPDPDTSSQSYHIPAGAAQDESLTMVNAVAIPAGSTAGLTFTTRQGLESTYDFAIVEVSTGSGSFTEVARYTGPDGLTPADAFIGSRTIDLTPFAGQSIKIRLRVESDAYTVGAMAGWYVDNIAITASAFSSLATNLAATSLPVNKGTSGTYCYRVRTRYNAGSLQGLSPWSNVVNTVVAISSAGLQISGTVFDPSGIPLRNAPIYLDDRQGNRVLGTTGNAGEYRFFNVVSGRTHTIAVPSKRYRFRSKTVTPTSNLTNQDFTAQQ